MKEDRSQNSSKQLIEKNQLVDSLDLNVGMDALMKLQAQWGQNKKVKINAPTKGEMNSEKPKPRNLKPDIGKKIHNEPEDEDSMQESHKNMEQALAQEAQNGQNEPENQGDWLQ